MNRLVLIGNGFDLAHDLKTSYADFFLWYKCYWIKRLHEIHNNIAKDPLCTVVMAQREAWSTYISNFIRFNPEYSLEDIFEYIINDVDDFDITLTPFFKRIRVSIETKGWVDIENEYYELLKQYALDGVMKEEGKVSSMKSLNRQLDYIKELLIQYLTEITEQDPKIINSIKHEIYAPFKKEDMSVHADYHMFEEEPWEWEDRQDRGDELMAILEKYGYGVKECMEQVVSWIENEHDDSARYPIAFMLPKNIMMLNFNYTHTAQIYKKTDDSFEEIHIHGDIDDKEHVIFGYGDEMHSDFEKLKEREDGESLRYVKSIRYLEATNYKKVLRFVESAPFQVVIMGHSCGRSDRTLLHTIFEHGNCASIKLCYYRKEDGSDDYLEKIQNISRNFVSMEDMRDVVVPKPQCKPLVHDVIEMGDN